MNSHFVSKPQRRGFARKILGREYFILKRKLKWLSQRSKYAEPEVSSQCSNILIAHKSFLLRPLKDVEMYLQHNKVTNLRLAIENLNGALIKSGQILSVWKQIGRPSKKKVIWKDLSCIMDR